MDADTIRTWIAQAEEEVARRVEEYEMAQTRLAEARRQLMLLYEMLATVTNSPVSIATEELGMARRIRERVQAHAEAILREHGKPMRITDLHAAFVRKGFPLPGRGTPTNIVAHLVASDRFSRHSRGVYGLVEWERSSHSAEAASQATSEEPAAHDTARAPSRQELPARSS